MVGGEGNACKFGRESEQCSIQVGIGQGTVVSPVSVTNVHVAHLADMFAAPAPPASPPLPPSVILSPGPDAWPSSRWGISLCTRSPAGDWK